MSPQQAQNLKNHTRFDPAFHFVLVPILSLNLILSVVYLIRNGAQSPVFSVWLVILSLTVILACLKLRLYPLQVQDRVIRLEEQIRLQALAPQEWHTQIFKLTADQLIGLRFASNDEVLSLAKMALEQNLNRKQIKERIRTWRADDYRI